MFRKCLPLFLIMALIPGLFACGALVEEEEEEPPVVGEQEEEEEEQPPVVGEQEEEEEPPVVGEQEEEEEEQPPEADFEADVVEGQAPASITFTNNSANADECLWDFGDGTSMTTTTLDEPVTHEYTEAGTHTVTLTATKKGDPAVTDTATLTISIDHGPLAGVGLNTEAVRLGLGQTLTFTAEATDAYDNPVPEARFTWEVAEGVGTVDAGGVFTAAMQAGDHPQGIVATATLDGNTVTAAAAVTVALFPDINLDAVIREALGKLPGQEITTDELFHLRQYLAAGERGIIDLTGMERCPNLSGIDLSANQITDITPLANLQYLMSLNLSGNRISDISPLTNFRFLAPYDRPYYNSDGVLMGYYTVQADVSRPILDLSGNQISDISPLAHIASLTRLSLEGNRISDISPLGSLTKLTRLNLGANPLNDEAVNVIIPQLEERGVEVTR